MKAWKLGYEKAKAKAKAIYVAIGHIPCPALGGGLIAFTSIGFNHLVRKGRNPRPRNEQKRRFVLLSHVETIVQNPRATIEYRQEVKKVWVNRHGERLLVESTAEFWTFVERVGDCMVKVVVRQLGTGGPKHFFSVMGDNVVVEGGVKNKKSRG
jgi:hypothetical protein